MRLFSGFKSGGFRTGVYTGRIAARSTSEPSRDIVYTVDVEGPNGVVTFANIAPQESARWLNFPDLLLVPFEIGQLVTVHVFGRDGNYAAVIESAEKPNAGPCP